MKQFTRKSLAALAIGIALVVSVGACTPETGPTSTTTSTVIGVGQPS